MMGAAGAVCCLTAGTALGSWLRERRQARLNMLRAQEDALGALRQLLEQERVGLPELLRISANHAPMGLGGEQVSRRLLLTADLLEKEPLLGLSKAFEKACDSVSAPWEKTEERAAMDMLFMQLGVGTAAMRAQAVAACLRRLKPISETARAGAENGGKLCMQLGMLLGLMVGIAVW